MHHLRNAATAVAAGLVLATAACSSGGAPRTHSSSADSGSDGSNAGSRRFTIAMITHEQPGTTFWDRVHAGAERAAKKDNITLKYANDPQEAKQATLVQNAIDSKVDGLAVTLAGPQAVGPEVAKAVQAGIPTVAFNAGIDDYQKYGAMMYFGSDETLAGETAGARLAKEGGKKALCVIHAAGVTSLEARCNGVKKAFPDTETISVDGANLAAVTTTIQAKLAQDHSITDIVTLDAGVASAAITAKNSAGSHAKIVTFDLNQDVVKAIQNKTIEFCIDQQPYLQGYLAIDSLWLQLTNGNDIGGGKPVLTGPSFVDASNIGAIAKFAANNTR
jgi:simple sugar transport system substrate-binding protein